MCCCCPPAISALFCLWTQSGCSKATVAGALTFFPPEPPLYQFQRNTTDGRVLEPDEDVEEPQRGDTPSSKGTIAEQPTSEDPPEAKTEGQTQEKLQSPMQQLTEQAMQRRRRAKERAVRDSADAKHAISYKLLLDPRLQVPSHDDNAIEAVKIPSLGRTTTSFVAAVIYRVPNPTRTTKTIIYSHGNATDIGAMFPIQVVLAHSLDVNVVVYDYSGYGESGGEPLESSTYRDIEAVYEYVLTHVVPDRQPRNVILYGQSVGGGPCCYLAAQEPDLGGMILHSAFTSGMRVLTPSRLLACLDIYPNIDRIKHVTCPVMVLHGQLDQEVDASHGRELHNAVPHQYQRDPWWVADRGHNDVTEGPGKLGEYVRRLRRFLNTLEAANNNNTATANGSSNNNNNDK